MKSAHVISVTLTMGLETAADNGELRIDSSSTDSPRTSESALDPCKLVPWGRSREKELILETRFLFKTFHLE